MADVLELRCGDDSDFLGRTIRIKLNTDIDLTGWKAVLKIQGLTKVFDDISEKVLTIVLSHEDTCKLKSSNCCTGYLKLIEPNGRQGTVDFKINVLVKPQVVEYAE
jgi:hypothetical protein